jgi:pimeloyl-ACP methyl ester carboxylesterase
VALLPGCASNKWVTLRSVPQNPLVDELKLTASGGPSPSPRTMQLLRVYNLDQFVNGEPRSLLEKMQAIMDREPSPDKVYALAELAYLGARRVQLNDESQARNLYGAAVLHAYRYLFDGGFAGNRNPYDPQFRGACDLYNQALEAGLRIEIRNQHLQPGWKETIQTSAGPWDIECVLRGGEWHPEEFDHFDFVSNYEIHGLKNTYHTYGLGVPLIAVRKGYPGEAVAARYYPPKLSFPVTAFLRPVPVQSPDSLTSHRFQAVLELYDPLTTSDILNAGVRVPLESDLTTPLAYFLSDPQFDVATKGLLDPEALLTAKPPPDQARMGLYMVQPYEAGKIPVVMVHGLWSDPMTWMEMFNDLRSIPVIREHYQFWFYLYPSGEPFWISAAQMRNALAGVRQTVDPQHQEPALDQMVLVGHSMGGLVSKLQVLNSGTDYWATVSREPVQAVRSDPAVLAKIENCFFFQTNPSIRRVITIATPHRGSKFSNQTTQWLMAKLASPLQMLQQSQQQLYRDNPHAFDSRSLLRIANSMDSLAPDSPIFPVMLASRRPPWVKYHNIIGLVPDEGIFGHLAAGGDGVVSLESARVGDVESELIVPAYHTTVHQHPLAVLEVRRILLQHLAELQSFAAPQVTSAASPPGNWQLPSGSPPQSAALAAPQGWSR